MAVALRYAARTDLGLGPKSRNEDSGYAGPHLLVLADGMGGHAAGDVASSMIVGHLAPLDGESLGSDRALGALDKSIRAANDNLRRAMKDDPDLSGMGTTTIAMLRSGNKLAMAHIGDSRAYLLRDGTFSQITKDHSFVQQLVDEERISAEEAEHHPQRSLVTRVMTGNEGDEPDLSVRELKVGDRYLLCSDGLSDFVGREVLEEILTKAKSPDEAADRCIEVALKASARDNVTVLVADVVDPDRAEAPSTVPQIVGAAAVRVRRSRTRAIPVSPAEKAARLSREASGRGDGDDDHVPLAEENRSPFVVWGRRLSVAAVAVVVLVGGSYAAYDWSQRQFYMGAQSGYVAIFRGVIQDLGPIRLSHAESTSDVALTDLPTHYQQLVLAKIPVGTLDDAWERVGTLRVAAADCREQKAAGATCGAAVASPGTTTTSTPGTTTGTTSTGTTSTGTTSTGTATGTSPTDAGPGGPSPSSTAAPPGAPGPAPSPSAPVNTPITTAQTP